MSTIKISGRLARRILAAYGFPSLYEPGSEYHVVVDESGRERLQVAGKDEVLASNPFTSSWFSLFEDR